MGVLDAPEFTVFGQDASRLEELVPGGGGVLRGSLMERRIGHHQIDWFVPPRQAVVALHVHDPRLASAVCRVASVALQATSTALTRTAHRANRVARMPLPQPRSIAVAASGSRAKQADQQRRAAIETVGVGGGAMPDDLEVERFEPGAPGPAGLAPQRSGCQRGPCFAMPPASRSPTRNSLPVRCSSSATDACRAPRRSPGSAYLAMSSAYSSTALTARGSRHSTVRASATACCTVVLRHCWGTACSERTSSHHTPEANDPVRERPGQRTGQIVQDRHRSRELASVGEHELRHAIGSVDRLLRLHGVSQSRQVRS